MAKETFKLNFITNSEGILTIDEPTGFDGADFVSKQKEKGLARSVSFSGGETEFTFYRMRNHYFDTLMYYYETYGWESKVQLIIEKDGIDNIVGDLDFYEAKTDQLEYFTCKVIQDSDEALLDKRKELDVNVFSDKNIDLEDIEPLSTQNVLVKSKPTKQASSWETPSAFTKDFSASDNDNPSGVRMTNWFKFNPAINLTSFEIDDTLTFFEQWQISPFSQYDGFGSDFKIIEAKNNLRLVKIDLSNHDFNLQTSVQDGGEGYVSFKLELRYGPDYESATQHIFFSGHEDENQTVNNTNDYSFTIPYLNRGDNVWLHYTYKVRQSKQIGAIGGNRKFIADTTINSLNVNVSATRVAYNTIVPSIRLYDGVSQVVKSISGLTTSFPFAEFNGEMYNQRLFNGNLLRNITSKDFNISLKNIEDWLPEIYGDYETQADGSVFFGLYADYYKNTEIGVFTDVRFDDYQKSLNKRYAINQFNYEYSKYQSQKETEVENTFDVVHGKSQWSVLNKGVENKKEVKVGFVRDSFYIDEQRVKAFNLNNNTSTQDDDTIFILDTKEATADNVFSETDFLQHTYDEDTGHLKLTNTGEFSFILLGLAVGETFKINGLDANAGTYSIVEVTERYIVIDSGSGSTANNGERITGFTYIVSTTTAPFVSWSDEDFDYIDNITDKDGFANLKYTIKRNVKRFYDQYLATCNIFSKKVISSTSYSNNDELSLSYQGLQTIEGQEFTPTNPILSPYTHNITLVTDFNTYKDIEAKCKTERGYIRTFDANGLPIKVFPQEMTFKNTDEVGELTIVGEEKHNPSLIKITYGGLGYIIINDEYRTPKITYTQDGEKFLIKDEDGLLLYSPVFWQKISINDAFASSKTELIEWLSLIS